MFWRQKIGGDICLFLLAYNALRISIQSSEINKQKHECWSKTLLNFKGVTKKAKI